jgi:NitT/TauT family transport system ATP-binding protein
MTVEENVAFGLEIKKQPRAQIEETVRQLLGKLSLREFADRYPKDLSGGMRQRVAIARALALDAPMLLLDEPFGALDALTRRTLQDALLQIFRELKKTALFVTHSIEESIYLADRVAIMTYRPGTLKRVIDVALPHPRDLSSPEAGALAKLITQLVMEEERRHQSDELRAGR